jgi:hypothetical protein
MSTHGLSHREPSRRARSPSALSGQNLVDLAEYTQLGDEGSEGSRLGEGARTGRAGEAGPTALRLCNLHLARQMLKEDFKKAAEKELAGNGAVGDCLLQVLPKPDAGY